MYGKASLASQIEGKVLTPGDDGYEDSLKRWASNFERRAEYVVYVKSAEDISKTVSIAFYFGLNIKDSVGHRERARACCEMRWTFRHGVIVYRRCRVYSPCFLSVANKSGPWVVE